MLTGGAIMSALFIIGNGFDIAHGIPTKYNDFRKLIIDKFPDALEFRDEVVYMEDCEDIYVDEFAAEILLNTMDKVCGENWGNFEEALAQIDFDNKFPPPEHEDDEIDEDDCCKMQHYLLYMDMLTSVFIKCTNLWQEFFRIWVKGIEQEIETRKYDTIPALKEIFSRPNTQFFTFNYTKTLQILYSVKKVIHIHNRSGQNLIFGHGAKDIMYGEFNGDLQIGSSFLDDMVISFKKNTTTPMKKYNKFFRNLNSSVDQIYSYGFSYSKVDSIYIKEIIKRISPTTTWYFTKFDAQDKESLRIKKIKLRNYGFKGTFELYEG